MHRGNHDVIYARAAAQAAAPMSPRQQARNSTLQWLRENGPGVSNRDKIRSQAIQSLMGVGMQQMQSADQSAEAGRDRDFRREQSETEFGRETARQNNLFDRQDTRSENEFNRNMTVSGMRENREDARSETQFGRDRTLAILGEKLRRGDALPEEGIPAMPKSVDEQLGELNLQGAEDKARSQTAEDDKALFEEAIWRYKRDPEFGQVPHFEAPPRFVGENFRGGKGIIPQFLDKYPEYQKFSPESLMERIGDEAGSELGTSTGRRIRQAYRFFNPFGENQNTYDPWERFKRPSLQSRPPIGAPGQP